MKYAYEDLSDGQFEKLVVLLCQELLGVAVQGFSDGPDGGRDAKFIGTANLHPSTAAPWVGITIIQAKHTNGYNRHFSESDFYSPEAKNTILGDEIPKIRKLKAAKQLDNYMVFANRRLAGNAESEIRKYLAAECGLPESSIYLCGVEQLELWMKRFPNVPTMADLDPIDGPLIVGPDDIAEVVMALARQAPLVKQVVAHPPTERVLYDKKNKLNNMTEPYAKELRKKYLKYTTQIQAFLAAPENADVLALYESAVDEFQLKIISRRKDYQTFDRVMEYLLDLLFNRDATLRQNQHKRLTRVVLFYMYWNCDIGRWTMLRPSKHSHPDQTIVNVAMLVLKRLKSRRLDECDKLRNYVKSAVIGGDALYLPSLNLLYLLGLIDYRPKTDSIEYVGPNEIV